MKKIISILLLSFCFVSCVENTKQPIPTSTETNPQVITTISGQNIHIVHLTDEVIHGLNKVVIDDSTTILIYRGVESCTMIQLK